MLTAMSILFLRAMRIAVECSAALPMMATRITPTKTSVMPQVLAVAWTAPTRNSLITATNAVATSSTVVALPIDQPSVPIASSASSPCPPA